MRGKPSVSLVRIHLENGQIESHRPLNHNPAAGGAGFRDVSVVSDAEGEEIFFTTWVEGESSQIAWLRPRTGQINNRFNPLDETTTLTALALSPTSRTLAMRLGPPGVSAPVVVYVPETDRFLPMVPDDEARAAWVGFMLRTLRTVLGEWPARPDATNPAIERSTPLPVPGDTVEEPAAATRVVRLARLGRPICDRPSDLGPIDPEFALRLDEAKLIFDYLRPDYPAALADLDAIEDQLTDRRSRLQALIIRTQIAIGQGELDQARDTLKYLRELPGGPTYGVEETPQGRRLTDLEDSDAAWLTCLSDLIAQRAIAGPAAAGAASTHMNPDAPDFEPPDAVIENVAPPPFRRVPVNPRGVIIRRFAPRAAPPAPAPPARIPR